jgi:cytosine/uracil/thiamine/allantoin permease
MDAQAIVWFVIAAVAGGAAIRLVFNQFIAKKPSALHSPGGTTLFAICLLLFAVGAIVAGFMTAS